MVSSVKLWSVKLWSVKLWLRFVSTAKSRSGKEEEDMRYIRLNTMPRPVIQLWPMGAQSWGGCVDLLVILTFHPIRISYNCLRRRRLTGEGLYLVHAQKFVKEMYRPNVTVVRHDLLKQVDMHSVEGSCCLAIRCSSWCDFVSLADCTGLTIDRRWASKLRTTYFLG